MIPSPAVTPAKLRQLADLEDEAALRALDQGDAAGAKDYRLLATLHRETANELERQGLPSLPGTRKLVHSEHGGAMTPEHRVEMSKSRTVRDKRFMSYIREKGYSLNRLAKAKSVDMSPSALSQARRKPTDPLYRRIPDDKAKAIEALTGWPASDWP